MYVKKYIQQLRRKMQNITDIGVLGLGAMGQNLALNFASKGLRVSVYNRVEANEGRVISDFISLKFMSRSAFLRTGFSIRGLTAAQHMLKQHRRGHDNSAPVRLERLRAR